MKKKSTQHQKLKADSAVFLTNPCRPSENPCTNASRQVRGRSWIRMTALSTGDFMRFAFGRPVSHSGCGLVGDPPRPGGGACCMTARVFAAATARRAGPRPAPIRGIHVARPSAAAPWRTRRPAARRTRSRAARASARNHDRTVNRIVAGDARRRRPRPLRETHRTRRCARTGTCPIARRRSGQA